MPVTNSTGYVRSDARCRVPRVHRSGRFCPGTRHSHVATKPTGSAPGSGSDTTGLHGSHRLGFGVISGVTFFEEVLEKGNRGLTRPSPFEIKHHEDREFFPIPTKPVLAGQMLLIGLHQAGQARQVAARLNLAVTRPPGRPVLQTEGRVFESNPALRTALWEQMTTSCHGFLKRGNRRVQRSSEPDFFVLHEKVGQ